MDIQKWNNFRCLRKRRTKQNYIHEEGKYRECFTGQFLPSPSSLYNINLKTKVNKTSIVIYMICVWELVFHLTDEKS